MREIEVEPSSVYEELEQSAIDFYRRAITLAQESGIPFLVGGAYALAYYAGIVRHTKDFDMFVREEDAQRLLDVFAAAGMRTETTFAHWLGKAYEGDLFVDVIFSAGNGVADVDDAWFEHAVDAEVLGLPAKLIPPEEMIWSKGFVMERERYDGADINHLLRTRAQTLDWRRLLARFAGHWRVFSAPHPVRYVYPGHRHFVPDWVMNELMGHMRQELSGPSVRSDLCQGTFLSRAQYLVDIQRWGYKDGRLSPTGDLTEEHVTAWTDAIDHGMAQPTILSEECDPERP